MSTSDFDASRYMTIPTLTLAAAITVARELVASGKRLPNTVAKARARLAKLADDGAAAYSARQREAGQLGRSERAVDYDADAAWSGLRARLQAYADLPPDDYPRAQRAGELVAALFPAGLEFTRASFAEQSTHMAALLERIKDDKLDKDLAALAGPEFLARVREVQPRYEEMVRAMLGRERHTENLGEHRRALSRAIVAYAAKVCATVEEDEPETIAAARAALRPLENIRGRRSGGAQSEEQPEEAPATPGAPESPDAPEE